MSIREVHHIDGVFGAIKGDGTFQTIEANGGLVR